MWKNLDTPGDNRVPTVGDTANFYFDATAADRRADELFVKPGSSFSPSIINYHNSAWNTPAVPTYQMTDLTIEQFNVIANGTSGGIALNHWRVGSAAGKGWLMVSSTDSNVGKMTGSFDIVGPLGTATITLNGSEDRNAVCTRINEQSGVTGVNARVASNNLYIETVNAGAGNTVTIANRTGEFKTQRYANCYLDSGTGWDAANATLTLTGSTPITMTGSMAGHRMFYIQPGSKIALTNSTITLSSPSQNPWNGIGAGGMGGQGAVEFTAAGGTITLESAGIRSQGTLGVGTNQLRVRGDQTWLNPSGEGFIRMTGTDGQVLVDSMDGGAVGFGKIPLIIDMPIANIGYGILPGEYGGLNFTATGASSGRLNTVTLRGEVAVQGYAIQSGNDTAAGGNATSNATFGLILGSDRRSQYLLKLNGYKLTVEKGMRIADTTSPTDGGYSDETTNPRRADARGSELVVLGDLEIWSTGHYAGHAHSNGTVYAENRNQGIMADATTTITIGGSFRTNVRSLSTDGWHLSTVNLIGGEAGQPATFEVGSDGVPGNDGDVDGFGAGTYAIGTLNIGDGTAPAVIRLVNEYLNDGDNGLTNPSTQPKSNEGEALMAHALNIRSGSVLDANGREVRIETSLTIAGDAWLDLNTGLALTENQLIATFIGLGDQTADWAVFAGRVMDSTNPSFTFEPTLEEGNTYWTAIPEPGTIALAVGGLIAMLLRRRRG